jgi:hypothetical protein
MIELRAFEDDDFDIGDLHVASLPSKSKSRRKSKMGRFVLLLFLLLVLLRLWGGKSELLWVERDVLSLGCGSFADERLWSVPDLAQDCPICWGNRTFEIANIQEQVAPIRLTRWFCPGGTR